MYLVMLNVQAKGQNQVSCCPMGSVKSVTEALELLNEGGMQSMTTAIVTATLIPPSRSEPCVKLVVKDGEWK